ncbi:MAG: DUF4390 domain-containing protein [Sideroxydans sp.]
MRCCTNIIKSLCRVVLFLCCISLASTASAEGIEINKVEARLTGEGYRLTADFKIVLPPSVEQALKRGVTLYFVSELAVHRSRWYWLDTDIESFKQTTKLSYNTLTRQYRLSRGGLYQSFFELKDALRAVGYQTCPPIPVSLLDNSGGYLSRWSNKYSQIGATATMRLDLTQLPKPLQVNALTSDQWSVESKLYHWDISPEAPGSEDQK